MFDTEPQTRAIYELELGRCRICCREPAKTLAVGVGYGAFFVPNTQSDENRCEQGTHPLNEIRSGLWAWCAVAIKEESLARGGGEKK